ncbi:MAG TPA: hypothetical protein DCQ06_11755 [Myxococcales bacterium]|nr:hypothetical protein [Myxococcales bacterium]HAN32263.1 hypothetical protein [Myxococcales bacterium]
MIQVEPSVPRDPQAAAGPGNWAHQRRDAVERLPADTRVLELLDALGELDAVLEGSGSVSLRDELIEIDELEIIEEDSETEAEAFVRAERSEPEQFARAETIVLSAPDVHRKIRSKQSIVPEQMAAMLYSDVRSLFEIGDREGALVSLERLIIVAPLSSQVDAFLTHNEPRLMEYYGNVFGPFSRTLRAPTGPNPMPDSYFAMDKVNRIWRLVDGDKTVHEIIELSEMRTVEACAVISQLVRSTAVEVSE